MLDIRIVRYIVKVKLEERAGRKRIPTGIQSVVALDFSGDFEFTFRKVCGNF